jgi:hypothetical protein
MNHLFKKGGKGDRERKEEKKKKKKSCSLVPNRPNILGNGKIKEEDPQMLTLKNSTH